VAIRGFEYSFPTIAVTEPYFMATGPCLSQAAFAVITEIDVMLSAGRNGLWFARCLAILALGPALALAQSPPTSGPPLPGLNPTTSVPGTNGSPEKPPEEQVVDVKVQGNRAVSTQRIMNEIRTRTGRAFDQNQVADDIRRLNNTHKFADVRPLYQRVPGGVIVTFQITERAILEYVKYVGNKSYKSSKLKDQCNLDAGMPLDPYMIEEGRRKIEQFYKEHGYNMVQVEVYEGSKITDHGAVYMINEGDQQKIYWVNFIGNTIVSEARLRTQIQSKPGVLWLFKGYADPKKIDEDMDKLTAYYRSLGYFQAKIGRHIEYNDAGTWMTLKFVIDEGPRYLVRNVTVVGNSKFKTDEVTHDLKLKTGGTQYFDQASMNKDVNTIRDLYGGQGYVFADIQAEPRFLEEPGKLDLVYQIAEGKRYRVGIINIHIAGDNQRTRQQTVLNRISLHPGDIVDTRQLRASERRLKASALFKNDPTGNLSPKIVMVPPGLDDAERINWANRPKNSPPPDAKYRGQSPDNAVPRKPDSDDALVDLHYWEVPDAPPPAEEKLPPLKWSAPGQRTPAANPTTPTTLSSSSDDQRTRQQAVVNPIRLRPGDVVDIQQIDASEQRLKASALFQNDSPATSFYAPSQPTPFTHAPVTPAPNSFWMANGRNQ